VSKELAARHLEGTGVRPVLGRVVVLVYAENTGAFLSLGENLPRAVRGIVLVAIPLVLVVGMTVYAVAATTISWPVVAGLGFIVGGGAGNLWDRLFSGGSVVDFMNIGVGPIRTGVFNMADLAIMLGCILILIDGARRHRKRT
jgi:signal peptidase II